MQIRKLALGDLETNCYILWDVTKQALVIDPADEAERILALIREEDLQVVAVVLTHAHFDHMLAAEQVCSAVHAPLYVGRGDADAMTDPVRNLSRFFDPAHSLRVFDFVTLKENDTLNVGNAQFKVLETPGHTPGCICLLTGDYLFSGDTLFENSIGRLDFPGGDPEAMVASLQRLLQLSPATSVFPGHGSATTIGQEIAHNPYLQ